MVHESFHSVPLPSQMVLQNVDKAQLKLRSKKDNVAGIGIELMEKVERKGNLHGMRSRLSQECIRTGGGRKSV